MKNVKLVCLVIITVLLLSNCQKDNIFEANSEDKKLIEFSSENQDGPDCEVINGMLRFKSDSLLVSYMEFISGTRNEQLDGWENKLGFESNRSETEKAYEIARLAKNMEELKRIVSEYSEFIVLDESSGEEVLEYVIKDRFFASITNSQGYFITGTTINKVLGDYIISTELSDSDLLKSFSIQNVSSLQIDNVNVQNIRHSVNLKTDCGGNFVDIAESGRYRVKTEGYIQTYVLYYSPYPSSVCTDAVQITTGYKKTLVWFKKKSDLVQGGHGTMVYNLNNGGDVTVSVSHPYYLEDDVQDIEVHHRILTLDSHLTTYSMHYTHIDTWGSSTLLATNATFLCGS